MLLRKTYPHILENLANYWTLGPKPALEFDAPPFYDAVDRSLQPNRPVLIEEIGNGYQSRFLSRSEEKAMRIQGLVESRNHLFDVLTEFGPAPKFVPHTLYEKWIDFGRRFLSQLDSSVGHSQIEF